MREKRAVRRRPITVSLRQVQSSDSRPTAKLFNGTDSQNSGPKHVAARVIPFVSCSANVSLTNQR